MIVCKVERWPDGQPEYAEVLGVLAIKNLGKVGLMPDSDQYDYAVTLQGSGHNRNTVVSHWTRRGWKTLVRKAFAAVEHG